MYIYISLFHRSLSFNVTSIKVPFLWETTVYPWTIVHAAQAWDKSKSAFLNLGFYRGPAGFSRGSIGACTVQGK